MKSQLIFFIFILLSLVLISEGIEVWNKLQKDAQIAAITDPDKCSEYGGEIENVCSSGAKMCVVKFNDAGKYCSNSTECLGACLSSNLQADLGDKVQGICASSTQPCGLFLPVKNGVVAAYMNVD